MSKAKLVFMATCVLLGVAIGMAFGGSLAKAQASPTSYLYQLENSPYNFYGPMASFLSMGHQICYLESTGMARSTIKAYVVMHTGSGIYSEQAEYMISAAESELCYGGNNGSYAA